jgi:4-amino-4-deoxy-L-arabinose transferase-like glycosyltransferase
MGEREKTAKHAAAITTAQAKSRRRSEAAVVDSAILTPMPSDHDEAAAASPPREAHVAWWALVLGVIPLLGAWFPRSPEPPQSWDQATHLLLASDYHDAWVQDGFPAWRRVRDLSSFYPPFYHVCVAALFPLTGPSSRAAGVVGGVMLLALALATGAIARRLYGLPAGVTSAAFVFASPSFGALAGQPLLDLTLAAVVAAAVWLSTTPRFLDSTPRALGAGLLAACGLLTKWVFPVFVAGPLLVRLVQAPRRPLRRWVLAAATAALLAGAWYVPHRGELLEQARVSSEAGRAEGDPSGLAVDSLTYYPYAVVMFFPLPLRVLLLVAAVAGALRRLRRGRAAGDGSGWLLASWLAVPLVVFTSIANKDPRYIAAAAPALAILAARAVGAVRDARARGLLLAGVAAYTLVVQLVWWRASDPPSAIERALDVAPRLAAQVSLDVQAFVVPDPKGWPARDVVEAIRGGLTRVSPWASLAVVPDLPYVNPATLRWAARRAGYDLRTFHPSRPPSVAEYSFWEYALVKPRGAQGTRHATRESAAITADVTSRPDLLAPLRTLASPDGPLLLVRTRHSLPPADLRPRDGRIDLSDEAAFWHLGDGWSFREAWGRWAIGDRAVLRVELPRGVARRMTLSIAPPEPMVGAQVVTVRYGQRRLRSFRLEPPAWAWQEQSLELPAGVATGGIDLLSLSFTGTVPASANDPRALAAAVRFVRFEP